MSQFGGPSRQDDYGYFGPAKPSASASQFGSAPAAPAASSAQLDGNPVFGAPAPAFGLPAPPSYPSAPTSSGGRRTRPAFLIVGGIVLALVLLYGASFAWQTLRLGRPVVEPATLAGLSPVTDPALAPLTDQAEQALKTEYPNLQQGVAGYGDRKTFLMLVVLRGPVKLDREFADFSESSGITLIVEKEYGDVTCQSDPLFTVTYCIRSNRMLTVEAVSFKGQEGLATRAVNEAWDEQ